MGLLDAFTRRKLITSAIDATVASGIEPALELIAAARRLGPGLWVGFLERLDELKRTDDVRRALHRFVELFPADGAVVEALLRFAHVLGPEDCVELHTTVLAEQTHEGLALQLADAHLELGDVERAHEVLELYRNSPSPALQVKRGVVLLELDRPAEALPLLRSAIDWYDSMSRNSYFTGGVDPSDYHEARGALEEAIARTEGAEAVTVELMQRRQLDPRSGRNFRLLADALKVAGPRIAPSLELTDTTAAHHQAERLMSSESSRPAGLCLRGLAQLRELKLSRAREDFEACVALQPDHFGARTGIGVAIEAEQAGWQARVLKLPELPAPAGIERVVVDWPALNRFERRVVIASVAPLTPLLPALADSGRRIRLLPIDVRVTDLPEFADVAAERFEDDHRSFAALGGVAGDELALAGVDTLLDVTPEGWTFAHELSHLCELVLNRAQLAALTRLYRSARKTPWVFGEYALRNRHEFFAVHYTDYLCTRYGIPLPRPEDDEGRLRQVLSFYDALAAP